MTTPRSSVWKKRVFIGLKNELDVSKYKQTNKQIYLTKIQLFLKEKHNFKRVIQLHKLLIFFSLYMLNYSTVYDTSKPHGSML